jgi:hypothetical protein|tara:strand:+ start:3851 stop:4363 length:513 start_codon:yes stop_codon:yes gene_type:complete
VKTGSIISNYWDLIEYNVHHIRHSELKASLILTAYGIIFGLAYDISGDIPIPEKYKYILYLLIIIFISFTLSSIFYSFKTYIPRINHKLKKSVFFFHDINFHYKKPDVYSKELIRVMEDEKELKELLAEQAYINGVIASDKYVNVSKSIKFMIYSFCSLVVLLLFELLVM